MPLHIMLFYALLLANCGYALTTVKQLAAARVPILAGTDALNPAVIHGATLEDGCLIGLHATVLNGATVGARSLNHRIVFFEPLDGLAEIGLPSVASHFAVTEDLQAHFALHGEEVQRRVFETSGIALEWEIKRIGVALGSES